MKTGAWAWELLSVSLLIPKGSRRIRIIKVSDGPSESKASTPLGLSWLNSKELIGRSLISALPRHSSANATKQESIWYPRLDRSRSWRLVFCKREKVAEYACVVVPKGTQDRMLKFDRADWWRSVQRFPKAFFCGRHSTG